MGLKDSLNDAVAAVRSGKVDALGATTERGWTTYTDDERKQVAALRLRITEVKPIAPPKRDEGIRPVSIAVFGPPGCGKSTFVRKLLDGKTLHTFNLTQLHDPVILALALLDVVGKDSEVSYIFFDEFDAPLAGARWGWLPWFLAPMEDGILVDPRTGERKPLSSTVFFFAGGTAETLEAFSAVDQAAFRAAKGPDFVSRLSGYYDIGGLNVAEAQHRLARRASALYLNCKHRLEDDHLEVDDDLLRALLEAGRYRHGARSLKTVVSMTFSNADKEVATRRHLPDAETLRLHVDRGPLDPEACGGCVALSSGGSTADQLRFDQAWTEVAHSLWRDGATIAYGGHWGKGSLSHWLRREAAVLPKALTQEPSREGPRVWSFPPGHEPEPGDGKVDDEGVFIEPSVDRLEDDEGRGWSKWVSNVITLFRMRVQVTEASVARVVMCGKTIRYSGRFPGIAEEVMLSLRARQPVYIAGGFGGAARDVGMLLGLGRPWTGANLPSFQVPYGRKRERELKEVEDLFRPPPWKDLPVTVRELVPFMEEHAIGGTPWPENGLSVAENRQLFRSQDAREVAGLVQRGLRRHFWGKEEG